MIHHLPIKRILVPIDFSAPALSALDVAISLAQRFGAKLELVHVAQLPHGVGPLGTAAEVVSRHWRAYRREIVRKLRRAAPGFPSARLVVRALEGDSPALALMQRSAHASGNIIVMGTHGRTGMQRALSGSVAEAVVRHANVPVLTVHQRTMPLRIRKMLIPVNMTSYSDRALRYALEWAEAFQARASVLHVAADLPEAERAVAELKARLDRLFAGQDPGKIQVLARTGSVERAIVEEAATGKFDLIVLSAHRKPFWSDYTLGATACRVLRHSPIPVLSVPSVGASRPRRAPVAQEAIWAYPI